MADPTPPRFLGRRPIEAQFRSIVDRARTGNPFYAQRITEPTVVPILDRATVCRHNDEILNGNEPNSFTSGSTAEPVRIYAPPEVGAARRADVNRYVTELGGPRVPAVIREVWSGVSGWNIIDVGTPIDRQIETIVALARTRGVNAITTYPSNADLLSQRVIERGVDTSFVLRFGFYSEMIAPYQRALVRRAFPSAQIWSTYSSSEFGLIGTECPRQEGVYHLMTNRLGVELVDRDGAPVAPGTPGRVVVTDLLNAACPFIRYDVGDIATTVECPCGSAVDAAIAEIHGKVRGAFVHRNGDRLVWSSLSGHLRDLRGMRQFQVIQESVEHFVVRVVADDRIDSRIADAFSRHFGYLPERIDVEYVDSIPRDPSGKLALSICRV